MIFTTAVARGLMCVSGSHSEAGNLRHEPHDGAPYLPEISGAKTGVPAAGG